jgi:hypothetical protein
LNLSQKSIVRKKSATVGDVASVASTSALIFVCGFVFSDGFGNIGNRIYSNEELFLMNQFGRSFSK